MTKYERLICEELSRRFPSSAAASGGNPLRLKAEGTFPELTGPDPDARESFLEAAENLEKAGIIGLQWKRFRSGEELLGIVLTDPQALFTYLDLPFPSGEAEKARAVAREAMTRARNDVSRALFTWMATEIRSSDTADEGKPVPISSILRDLSILYEALTIHSKDGILSGCTPRALSITLFSDSKRIESLMAEASPLLRRAQHAGVPVPDLSAVSRNYPETYISGSLAFIGEDGAEIENAGGGILGLPLCTCTHITAIRPLKPHTVEDSSALPRLLMIENLETFYALSTQTVLAEAFLYTGGHPNRPVQWLLRLFARSGFSLYHAGDLDPEGILILQELNDIAGRQVTPVKMDAHTFDAWFPHSRELKDTALKRAASIRDDTRSLPGIEALLERILATGRGVEQEIVQY